MKTLDLIEQVSRIVDNTSYTSTIVLGFLNDAQAEIADELMLPWLRMTDTVSTSTSADRVALPSTYHKGLYHAKFNQEPVDVYRDEHDMEVALGGFVSTEGDVKAVAADNGYLIYQFIPNSTSEIELKFYRSVTDMEEKSANYPAGFTSSTARVNVYDWALIHHACWNIFAEIEDGYDRDQSNTSRQKKLYLDLMERLNLYCYRRGKDYPRPSTNALW
jgi:hypothetical protein